MSAQPLDHTLLQFDLSDRLRKSLNAADIGVQEMADYLDVSRNTISRWINGEREPKLSMLRLWALRTGAPLEWLVSGEIKEHAPSPGGGGARGIDSAPTVKYVRLHGRALSIVGDDQQVA